MTTDNPETASYNRAEAELTEVRPGLSPKWRTTIFAAEILFVLVLFVWWFSNSTAQTSRSLWVLFFYCFPAEFIIAAVPHEPVLLFFAKFYSPLVIALTSVAGTLLAETLNYTAFNYVTDLRVFKKIKEGKTIQKTVALFHRAPFLALWVAGFTPIPFYPFRFLVVFAHYPLWKYLLAVFLSRGPRFFILAEVGRLVKFPDYFLITLFIILIAVANIPLLRRFYKSQQAKKQLNSNDPNLRSK